MNNYRSYNDSDNCENLHESFWAHAFLPETSPVAHFALGASLHVRHAPRESVETNNTYCLRCCLKHYTTDIKGDDGQWYCICLHLPETTSVVPSNR